MRPPLIYEPLYCSSISAIIAPYFGETSTHKKKSHYAKVKCGEGGIFMLEYYCPLEHTTEVIGGKWKLRIIGQLRQGPVRFNTLKRQIDGITDLMLTKSLKELMAADVVVRKQYESIPPHVEYRLTEHGHALIQALEPVSQWSQMMLQAADAQMKE